MSTSDVRSSTTSVADLALPTGLLILRIGVAAAMLQAGLIKALDFDATTGFMETGGWRLPTFAAFMVTAAETAGGIGLLLGLLTPLAASAVVGAMLCAWAVNVSGDAFWAEPFNVPFLIAIGAATLLFTGPGAYSIDARLFGWSRVAVRIAAGLLIVAIAAALLTWILLNGTNPINFTAPPG
jgi:putative oxidoreductase